MNGIRRTQAAGSWPQFQFDAANTGHKPNTAGPTEGVQRRWEYGTFASLKKANTPVVSNGTVYLGAKDFNVYALDAETGKEQWSVDTGAELRSAPIVANNTVYIMTDNGPFLALDAETGQERWTTQIQGDNMLAAYADGTIYLPGVNALDAETGDVQWRNDVGSSSGVAVADGVVYSGDGGTNRVYALNADDGSRLWRKRIDGRIAHDIPPAIRGDNVYFVTNDGTLFALNASSGAVQWRYEFGGTNPRSSPAVFEDTVVIGKTPEGEDGNASNTRGEIHAIDATTGENRWTVSTTGAVQDSPSILDGVVYVGSRARGEGTFYALDIEDGSELWQQTMRDDVQGHAMADGDIYVTTEGGYVTALEAATGESGTPSDSENRSPNARFDYSPEQPALNEDVTFDAKASSDPDGQITSYEWRIRGESEQHSQSGRRITQMFETAGEYAVELTVTDNDGATAQRRETVAIGAGSGIDGSGGGETNDGGGQDSDPARQRGFFTNSGGGPDALENVFNLTMLGFVLSVAGIVHQMLQGR